MVTSDFPIRLDHSSSSRCMTCLDDSEQTIYHQDTSEALFNKPSIWNHWFKILHSFRRCNLFGEFHLLNVSYYHSIGQITTGIKSIGSPEKLVKTWLVFPHLVPVFIPSTCKHRTRDYSTSYFAQYIVYWYSRLYFTPRKGIHFPSPLTLLTSMGVVRFIGTEYMRSVF